MIFYYEWFGIDKANIIEDKYSPLQILREKVIGKNGESDTVASAKAYTVRPGLEHHATEFSNISKTTHYKWD